MSAHIKISLLLFEVTEYLCMWMVSLCKGVMVQGLMVHDIVTRITAALSSHSTLCVWT